MKNNVLPLFVLISLMVPVLLPGEEKISDDTKLGLLFYFHTDQDAEIKDYYSAGGKVKLETKPSDRLKFHFEINAGNDEIGLDELWVRCKFDSTTVKFGLFENSLLYEDRLTRRSSIFANRHYLQDRLEDMGWYSEDSVGLRISEDGDKNGVGLNSFAELFYMSHTSELMLSAGFSYPWAKEDSFLGASLSYYPQFFSDMWGDDRSASLSAPSQDGFTENQYIMGSIYFGDRTKKRKLIYKLEAGVGNNLSSPVAYTRYPDDNTCSWFLGTDGWVGYIISRNEFEWTPGLNCTAYIHDMSEPEASTVIIKTGNRFCWRKDFYIHLDAGIEINRFIEDDDRNTDTDTEVLCAIRLQYQY